MAMRTLTNAPESTSEQAVRARIRDVAIEQFGQHGFDAELSAIAEAAGVNAELLIHEFGSIEGLRKACDDYILESIRTAKSESLAAATQAPIPGSANLWLLTLNASDTVRKNFRHGEEKPAATEAHHAVPDERDHSAGQLDPPKSLPPRQPQ